MEDQQTMEQPGTCRRIAKEEFEAMTPEERRIHCENFFETYWRDEIPKLKIKKIIPDEEAIQRTYNSLIKLLMPREEMPDKETYTEEELREELRNVFFALVSKENGGIFILLNDFQVTNEEETDDQIYIVSLSEKEERSFNEYVIAGIAPAKGIKAFEKLQKALREGQNINFTAYGSIVLINDNEPTPREQKFASDLINQNNTNVSLNLVKYRKIKWGDELSALSKAMIAAIDNVNLNDTATIKGKSVTGFIEQYHELRKGINESAQKLLDALLITATESSQSDTMIKLPLSEYMEMRGLKDVKTVREQVNDDLAALYRLSFRFERGKGKQQKTYELRLIQGKGYEMEEVSTGIVRGQIFARLSEDFFKIFKQYTLMFYPEEALKINTKYNPYSRYLLLKLAEHKKMNHGKKNERIVSVKTLLDVCASHGMPTVEALRNKGQHLNQQIIDPFERELDYLQDKGVIQWHYCGVNGAEIEPYQNYEEFEAQRVYFDFIDYPREPAVPEKKPRKPRAPRKQNIKK